MSKGSWQRPTKVERDIFESEWDRIFRSQKDKEYATKSKGNEKDDYGRNERK